MLGLHGSNCRSRACVRARKSEVIPLSPSAFEGESIPPLRNDHKSALVSLAVNKSAFLLEALYHPALLSAWG